MSNRARPPKGEDEANCVAQRRPILLAKGHGRSRDWRP
jgi:hypothetical protein